MSRTSKVTFAATAVTLTCLAGALYASPVVIAETLGREVQAYSPMEHRAFTQHNEEATLPVTDAGTDRAESTITDEQLWATADAERNPAPEVESDRATSQSVHTAATPHESTMDDLKPSESSTSRMTSEIPPAAVEPRESPDTDESQPASTEEPEDEADAETNVPEDVDSPESLTVIVNKLRPLPADYVPDDLVDLPPEFTDDSQQLREEAAKATEELFTAASEDAIELQVVSSYRSFDYQEELYDNYVTRYGVERTNGLSAQPGHSEHQTGLALDVDTPGGQHTLQTSFGETDAGQWLAEHAHEFGFVIRYPEGHQEVTGFEYEPWHLRYFGEQYATQIVENSGVAEEEFQLEPAPDYQ